MLDALGHLNHVGVCLLVNIDLNTFPPIGAGQHLTIALSIDDLPDVLQADFLSFTTENDCVGYFFQILILVDGSDHILRFTLPNAPPGGIDIFRTKPIDDLVDRKVGSLQLICIHKNVNFFLESPTNPSCGYPLDRLECSFDLQFSYASQPSCAGEINGAGRALVCGRVLKLIGNYGGQAQFHHWIE